MNIDEFAATWGIAFDHVYGSCGRTYATLCIYSDDLSIAEITEILGLEPDRSEDMRDPGSRPRSRTKRYMWAATTRDTEDSGISSRDFRAHVFELLENIEDGPRKLKKLEESQCEIRLWVFWSASGLSGGPTCDHAFIKWLSQYSVELAFDIYPVSDA